MVSRLFQGIMADTSVRNNRIQRVHSASIAIIIETVHEELPSDEICRGLLRRSPASTTNFPLAEMGTFTDRAAHITASDELMRPVHQTPSAKEHVTAKGAGAVHRALEADWANGIRLLRSVHVRALDVTLRDARALHKFFSLTDRFVFEYLKCSEFFLRHVGAGECCGLRKKAIDAMNKFRAAREEFMNKQGLEQVTQVVATGYEARRAVLVATAGEMGGTGELERFSLESLANWFSRADAGPHLVLFLARGVSAVPSKALRWAKRILFPQTRRAPRPLCMMRLSRALKRDHDAYAGVFRAAEKEHRILHTAGKLTSLFVTSRVGKTQITPMSPALCKGSKKRRHGTLLGVF